LIRQPLPKDVGSIAVALLNHRRTALAEALARPPIGYARRCVAVLLGDFSRYGATAPPRAAFQNLLPETIVALVASHSPFLGSDALRRGCGFGALDPLRLAVAVVRPFGAAGMRPRRTLRAFRAIAAPITTLVHAGRSKCRRRGAGEEQEYKCFTHVGNP
jgi:hypothetical protein